MSDESQACEVPLLERLHRVPEEAHEWRQDGNGWLNIPYGNLCNQAADALQQAQADKANLGKQLQDTEMAHHAETKLRVRLEAALRQLALLPVSDDTDSLMRYAGAVRTICYEALKTEQGE